MKTWNVSTEYNGVGDIISLLLRNRAIEDINEFLNPPTFSEYFNNFSVDFKNSLKKAKGLIEDCMEQKYQIVIYGDYDADGVSATAILYQTLKNELRYENTSFFIPNRFDHGYGMSTLALDEILTKINSSKILFITVDTGITAVEEIKYIKDKGHLVIITDHHQKPEPLPPADCIVWNDQMVGATISFLLSKILGSKNPQLVGLAALATVTDLQPILGFNRAIVKQGLRVLNTDPLPGIKKLIEVSGRNSGELDTYDLGWVIGPRLNASGRLVDAYDSLNLLIEKDPIIIDSLANKLNKINSDRQDKTYEMYEIASVSYEGKLPKIIISARPEYHEGIIGLVASKIAQKYYRPAIVISLGEEFGKGSVRSVKGVDIIALLRNFNDLFENLGGHPMAAGFTIKKENILELESKLLSLAEEFITDSMLIPDLNIDIKMPIELVNLDLMESIEKLKPYGLGNEEPIFLSESVKVVDSCFLGKENQHLRLKLYQNGNFYKAIFFGGAEKGLNLNLGDEIDIVYNIKRNEYNGNVNVDLIVKDLKVRNKN